jgi:hypothetical protein
MRFEAFKTKYGPFITGIIYCEDPKFYKALPFLIDTGAETTAISLNEILLNLKGSIDLKNLIKRSVRGIGGTQSCHILPKLKLFFLSEKEDKFKLAKELIDIPIVDMKISLLGRDVIGDSCSLFHNSNKIYLELKER